MRATKYHKKLHISQHPLVAHKLSILRDKSTNSNVFRKIVNEISLLLAMEASSSLPTKSLIIQTPLADAEGQILVNDQPIIVPILRAGLGMLDGFLSLMPKATVGYAGMQRNEETKESQCYYFKIPPFDKTTICFVCDPMLATGGSALHTITKLKEAGLKNIILVCIVAAPKGVEEIYSAHPEVPIYIASLDEKLNEHAYIVPGLGDAGDRLYGT